MTDKKMFYTDPLAAAYMSREFGVVMSQESKTGIFYPFPVCGRVDITHKHGEHEIIIYPESYHIFQPMVGDVIQWKACDTRRAAVVEEEGGHFDLKYCQHLLRDKNISDLIAKIIQRQGKRFVTPEVEQ